MTVFCEINNMLDNNEEAYEYNNDNIHIKINKIKNKYILECGSDKEEIEFVNDKKRRVICELNLQLLDMKKIKKVLTTFCKYDKLIVVKEIDK